MTKEFAIDTDDVDRALLEISVITRVAIGATDALIGSEVEPDCFSMP
jgi:hypothetical protein